MGAIISLPFTTAATFISSFLGATVSNLLSSVFSKFDTSASSVATRIVYALVLLINSLVSWISMSTNHSILYPSKTCAGLECGVFSVYRLNFALGLLHVALAITISSLSRNAWKVKMQNSLWALKTLFYFFTLFASFKWMSNDFFIWFSKYISSPSGAIFIFIGLILLVDFAHEYAEVCVRHVEEDDENSTFWRRLLISSTLGMYVCSFVMIVVMFVVFCGDSCNMNLSSAVINVVLGVVVTLLSIAPKVQEHNPKCGLVQSSIVTVYCTYLTFSAMASEPDDKRCNPLVRSSGTRRASIILGSLFTFIAIVYTTTRAAGNSAFNTSGEDSYNIHLDGADNDLFGGEDRSQLRLQAIREAVEEGSLPESALNDIELRHDDGDSESFSGFKPSYNYVLFHVIFFLATQWITMLLTINVKELENGDFIPVGRTYFYSWVKIISAWLCYGLYAWSMVAPIIFVDRFDYD
ncbi:hypothetical protein ACO0QE_002797 [Hanseniaspora vineae]